jgi:tetratricopeptide (TPR) repeat protein
MMRLFSGQAGARSPYCESCGKPVRMYSPMLGIHISAAELSERSHSAVVKGLVKQDWLVLKGYERLVKWRIDQSALRISIGRCESCSGPFCVSGEIRGRSGKAVITDRVFSVEIGEKSALQLLETAIECNLAADKAMYVKAIEYCKKLGSTKDFAKLEKARSLSFRASWELSRGLLDSAEAHFNQALPIFQALDEIKAEAMIYRSLASLYHRRKDLARTEALVKQSILIFEALDDKPEMAIGYGSLSQIKFEHEEYDSAEQLSLKALEVETALGNKAGMATASHALAAAYKAQRMTEQARDAFLSAKDLYAELGNRPLATAMESELEKLEAQ